MSVADNYDDVLGQLRAADLIIPDGGLQIGGSKSARCRVEGRGREKRGWYWLHDIFIDGRCYLVGAFGVYQGNDPGTQKIELTKQCEECRQSVPFKEKKCPSCGSASVKRRELTREQKEAIRTRLAEHRKREEAQRRREAERAAARARAMWEKCLPTGESPYLVDKGVQAHGARFTSIGTLVVPMHDEHAQVRGLQFIGPEVKKRRGDRNKDYWPPGLAKQGLFLLTGSPEWIVLLTEGYATYASLHEATGLPVAAAFDAGNLLTVAKKLHRQYPRARILACADDDFLARCPNQSCGALDLVAHGKCPACGTAYSHGNTGVEQAQAAALAVGGGWVAPVFSADRGKKKITDFNDLHLAEGLHVVRAQIEASIAALGWSPSASAAPPTPDEGGGGGKPLKPMLTVDEAVERYSLVYGGRGTLFDHQEHELVPKPDVLDLLQDHGWKEWKTRARRKVVRLKEVGFDPTESDQTIRCNLWGGWPTQPVAGACDRLLEMLEYMCSADGSVRDVTRWVLKWLAYPIQHPGAKMKTALIFHGPQGVGKNLFFEAIMGIYGPYGRIVDQAAIEDKFNDWASKKLFLIGDEVVARQELFHTKNKLKGFITGEWIRINPKNVAAHDERNHVNIVFLSNERQPLVLEKDDRRFTVIWTPEKLSRAFYDDVSAELKAGGAAALHRHLLNLDLGDFRPWTDPPMTAAKTDLIAISLDSVERFIADWQAGETDFPFCPCASMDLYAAYLRWCRANGVQRPRESNQFLGHVAKLKGWSNQPRHVYESCAYTGATRPRRIVIPEETALIRAEAAKDASMSAAQWLTDCFFRFRTVLEDMRA